MLLAAKDIPWPISLLVIISAILPCVRIFSMPPNWDISCSTLSAESPLEERSINLSFLAFLRFKAAAQACPHQPRKRLTRLVMRSDPVKVLFK